MCEMKVAVNKLMLGNRELGWECWDGKGVLELTSKQIRDLIIRGDKVCGLTIDEDGELVLDSGFFCTDLMTHAHVGNYKHIMNDAGVTNQVLVCIGSKVAGGKRYYDCISSRFEQLRITEDEMKAYIKIGLVTSGARLIGEEIEVASTQPEVKDRKVKQEQVEQ